MTGPEYLSPETGPDCGLQPDESGLRKEKAAEVARKSKDKYGWRRVVRNFTPSYVQINSASSSSSAQLQLPRILITHSISYAQS